MIAVVPVRYASTDGVWSREHFENWMRPGLDFSLGDFWWRCSRGIFDVSSQVYDPVVIPDPGAVSDNDKRGALQEAVVKAATQVDWVHTDILLIWLARPTGWWGGGEVFVPGPDGRPKKIRVTVVDSITPFDAACQELGHGFKLDHELDAAGTAWASPYSVMSARTYGPGARASWIRPSTPKLADGGPNKESPYVGIPANRIVGPLVPGAHLYPEPAFRDSSSVMHVRALPAKVRLYKPNYLSPGSGKPVLIAVPSQRRDGRMFFVELRRATTGTYDEAIRSEGLVVHSGNPDGRVRYDGVADLALTEWACAAGDFSLRLNGVGDDFADVEVRAGSVVSFPIRGVLLAGGFRTQHELNTMTHDQMRNTLIVVMASLSNQSDYQRFDNDTLAGMGAIMVFLRRNGLRDDVALKSMTADDQRNVAIVELGAQTGAGQALQGFTNLQLAQIALGSDLAVRGRRPGSSPFYGRGVLLAGRFRTQHQLNTMSRDDMRNTLIVVMTSLSNQTNYQAYNDADLAGVGAVMVFLRENGIRDDATLKKMSADDQRNVAIVELAAQTGRNLQGLGNLDLALVALGVERF